MAVWKRRKDPLSKRAKSLESELAMLQAQIRHLHGRVESAGQQPRLRSTAVPGKSPPSPAPRTVDPVFEPVDHNRVHAAPEPASTPEHFNQLGVRKYDLVAWWRRIRNHFHGPPASNPRLVSYLATGAIQGLRPMRYEKRVARIRLLGLAFLLAVILYGIVYVLMRR
jgi:hypothetical protein